MLMQLMFEDQARGLKTPVWEEYKTIINQVLLLPGPLLTKRDVWLFRPLYSFHCYIIHICAVCICRLKEKRSVWS